jgi:hypothetical protein
LACPTRRGVPLQNLVFQQGKSGFQANLSDSGVNLGVCAIPFALSQRQATKRAVAQSTFQKPDSAANLPEATPPATGAISAKALPNISRTRAVAASDDFK